MSDLEVDSLPEPVRTHKPFELASGKPVHGLVRIAYCASPKSFYNEISEPFVLVTYE